MPSLATRKPTLRLLHSPALCTSGLIDEHGKVRGAISVVGFVIKAYKCSLHFSFTWRDAAAEASKRMSDACSVFATVLSRRTKCTDSRRWETTRRTWAEDSTGATFSTGNTRSRRESRAFAVPLHKQMEWQRRTVKRKRQVKWYNCESHRSLL